MIPAFHIGFLDFRLMDALDILLVSVLLYQLYKLLKGTVAIKVFLGLLAIYVFYLLVNASGMHLLTDILDQFIGVGVLTAIILFQQEIRRFLLVIGKTTSENESLGKIFNFSRSQDEDLTYFNEIIQSVEDLSREKTGALIVLTHGSDLKEYAETGDLLDAQVNRRLLLSIFQKDSPMHDGAVIINDNRIVAARCIVPVTDQELPPRYGMRHRAAVGISEVCVSLVIIVSEETGEVSLAENGEMESNVSMTKVRTRAKKMLNLDQPSNEKRKFRFKPSKA